MADNIGQILGEEPMVPNSPMMPGIGQALTQGQPQQPAMQPTPEMLKDPKFHAIGQWIRKPENMLTALVLAGSLMQDRRPGQSKMDAVAERGLGTLGFRGEMRRLNQADTDAAAKQQSEIDWRTGQTKVAQERNTIDREGVGVQREQVQATRDNTTAQIAGNERMNTQDNQTRLMLARMEESWRLKLGDLEKEVATMGKNGPFGLDEKTIVDIFKNYADASANGVSLPAPGEQVQFILRSKLGADPTLQAQVGFRYFEGKDGKKYIDVNPEYRGLFGIPDGQGAPKATPGAPTPTGRPQPQAKAPAQKPKPYDVPRQPTPAIAGVGESGWKDFTGWRDSKQAEYDEAMKKGLETRK